MNGETAQPINILLSRDELLYILNTLKANFVLGIDSDPMGDRDAEQQKLAMTVAGRALRARGLAQSLQNGQTAIHNALLASVGVCAYPQQTVSIYHWPAGQEYTTRYFAHIRGNQVVSHTRPEDVLHLLSRLPSKEYLVNQIVTLCQYHEPSNEPSSEFSVPKAVFGRTRQLTEGGKLDEAISLLVENQAPAESAQALVTTLSHGPNVTIIQTLRKQPIGVERRECTVIQNSADPWLIRNNGEGDAPLTVKSSSKGEIQGVLTEWLK